MKSSIYYGPITKATATITVPPLKVAYVVGETFDPTGMVVSGTGADGTQYTINEFEATSYTAKPLTAVDTCQKMYIMIGNEPVLVSQAITVTAG